MACYPVFCTAKMPADVLEELLAARREETGPYRDSDRNTLYFVTPAHWYTTLRDIDTVKGAPNQDLTEIQPFSDWSVQECYTFYKTWLQDPPDKVFGNFSAFTFLILDAETLSTKKTPDHTVIICTDAPDITDIPKRQTKESEEERLAPVLKFRRSTFVAAVQTLDTWEMMTGMFSDLGYDDQLSFHSESWMIHAGYDQEGNELRKFITPGEARARQEKLLQDYVDGRRHVDMTHS